MHAGMVKYRDLSVDSISSGLKIMHNYLNISPFPDNELFSQGGMIEIVLSTIPFFQIKFVATVGLEPMGKDYKKLKECLENLKIFLLGDPQMRTN